MSPLSHGVWLNDPFGVAPSAGVFKCSPWAPFDLKVDSSQTLHFSIFYTPEASPDSERQGSNACRRFVCDVQGNNAYKKTRQQTIMRRILEDTPLLAYGGTTAMTVLSLKRILVG